MKYNINDAALLYYTMYNHIYYTDLIVISFDNVHMVALLLHFN